MPAVWLAARRADFPSAGRMRERSVLEHFSSRRAGARIPHRLPKEDPPVVFEWSEEGRTTIRIVRERQNLRRIVESLSPVSQLISRSQQLVDESNQLLWAVDQLISGGPVAKEKDQNAPGHPGPSNHVGL
jgi:hypothetical protein